MLNLRLTITLSFTATETYDFLAIEHASDDKVMDVLFVIKNSEGTQNNSCADAGMISFFIHLVFYY